MFLIMKSNKKNSELCELEFDDYPVTFELTPDKTDVIISCKGVTGLLSEGIEFMKSKNRKFGGRDIVLLGNLIQIDCLKDTKIKIKKIIDLGVKFKEKYTKNGNSNTI